jgi:TonB family protein
MLPRVLFNLMLSIFLCASLFAMTAFAQNNFCAIKMDVTRNGSETKISGAAATALNTKTKRVYRSVLKGGMPNFAKLPNGDYRVTVSKTGFKRTIDDYNLNCAENNDEAWSIELYKGISTQIVKLYTRNKALIAAPTGTTEAGNYSVGTVNMGRVDPNQNYTLGTNEGISPTQYKVDPNNPRMISGGVVNGKAVNLVKPSYPAAAKAVRAVGAVNVQVTIDEKGNVISAQAISGHPLLRAASVQAAQASTFSPTLLQGQPVKVTGIIVYNFVP